MATGRGWIKQQHINTVQKPGLSAPAPSQPSAGPSLVGQQSTFSQAAQENKGSCVRKPTKNKQLLKITCPSKAFHIESLPCESLLKIFSYLDPISLIMLGNVNKRFYDLSMDNVTWYKIYLSRRNVNQCWKCNSLEKKLSETTLSDVDPGYWKKTYIRELLMSREKKITQIIKSVKPFTCSEKRVNMEKAVKTSGLIWTLTFLDNHRTAAVIEQTDLLFRDSSLTVTWNSYLWPAFHSLTKLQLHGITPVLTDKCLQSIRNRLQRRSLIAEYDLSNKKNFGRYIGQDMHIKLFHLHPGLIIGLWKKSPEIAFVMGTLHYHQLLEKSLLGSAGSPYIFPAHVPILDDIDPNYGLHGYQLHIDMYSGPRTYLCRTFRGLFCRKEYIKNGSLRISVIGLSTSKTHTPVAGRVDFLWKTLILKGSIQNCFLMDVTVLSESEAPYWCFSAPVQLCERQSPDTLYDFIGQSFHLNYSDDIGRVHAELIWMKETEEHFVINLVLFLNTEKVNSYFGTDYADSPC
ncbi:F-box only protein 15 isoform 2-T3 [Anomaloglossus baeobatrachus]|uniref:F-box only protein 15 isoform X2 n=1 Tax=Anomaloglossus baeobatrachus TaxID=238106 RepID=UPI003F5081F1